MLAAWLVIYAAGSLAVVADAGLQLRAINRFLAFKACRDCDGRTANYYAAMLRIYFAVDVGLGVLVLVGALLLPPSRSLGFHEMASFDLALLVMTVGVLLVLPANLVSGLYRARGRYSRSVWLQNGALLLGQIAQLVALATNGGLVAVALAFVSPQILLMIYLVAYDAPRLFPFLRAGRSGRSWRWALGQFRRAFPFAVANLSELALVNAPVLMVSAFVVDRVAVAQWGLTRVIASFLRGLCAQVTLPIAAELGHDYAIGDRERLRQLYARGSTLVTVIASVIVAGLLPFWPDFFTLWTHGSIPYDAPLAHILLLGSAAVAPSLLALAFANHSNRGGLLVRTKGLQLVVFLVLSIVLIRLLGPLGAAIAVVASDLCVQFGLLGFVIMGATLRHPIRHTLFLAAVMAAIVLSGWAIGVGVASLAPGAGFAHFIVECAIWSALVALVASPLMSKRLRDGLIARVPA
ncbi:hypothetical protein [Bradyrhizobium betae]|nr:hypothetical protein [Bradyrhizobium betae]